MTTQTLKIACVGAGFFSQFHYDSWRRLKGVRVVGACDLDKAKAAAKAAPLGAQAFDDLDKMLADTKPDVLDVILPPLGHARAIQSALDAGVKTIICQKPFCMSLTEAREMTDAAQAAGAQIVIHENFRFQPWYRCIKQLLAKDAIGQVLQMTFRLRPGDGQGAMAYLDRQPYFQTMPRFLIHETGVHWVDTFRYLFGDPTAVYADLRRINPVIAGEDAGVVMFDHPEGIRTIFDGNRHLDHAADNHRRTMGEALVEGTEGTLKLLGSGAVMHRRFGAVEDTEMLAPSVWPGFGGDCVHHLQAHVVDALHDNGMLENTADSYLKVIEIEQAIYASAEEGRKIALDQ
ncbi:Gfo/Idh/MocA family oxidoreductase [Ascidiaceihabitans sp.]|uniref:Gfo/Idh/MocA family protein n=1 Tax=Ascidiaceihabitans sp. TaxID=1872644 RepID=UPI00329A6E43